MCGIAGIVSLKPGVRVDEAALRRMSDQIVHRGPDDSGHYVDSHGRAGLAFRRLSIIDLSGGHQPMSNEDETVWVAFNGEIYNFQELRGPLERAGHVFRTHSDTETIVHAYEEYGEEVFTKLAGMFAIALWDEKRGRLLLGRDRLGKKPLHYAVFEDRFHFGSELKSIVSLPGAPKALDAQSLHRYLILQYVPAPYAIYEGYYKVLPGDQLSVAAERPFENRPRAYWRVPSDANFDGSYDDAKARLGELLTGAVKKRLMSDVPLGAFLSGGIDSSVVVGLMRRLGADPLRTFSIGFEDPRYNEAPYARRVAEHFRTEHHEYTVTPRAREILETLAFHYDEPFADSSAIPTYYVSQWTRRSVTVALTGDAGDECFGGYRRYQIAQVAQKFQRIPRLIRKAVAAGAVWMPHGRPRSLTNRAYRFLKALGFSPARRYLDYVSIFAPDLLSAGYNEEFRQRLDFAEPMRWFEGFHVAKDGDPADKCIHTDFNSYLPYDLLTKVDIASMAVSLECRAPFLDHEVVEFAVSLPIGWRIGGLGGKHILKDWARSLLPEDILTRGKKGFAVPIGEWFRGELRGLLESRLLAPDSISTRVFRREWLRGMFEAHASGRENHDSRLWALLMLELWAARWKPEF